MSFVSLPNLSPGPGVLSSATSFGADDIDDEEEEDDDDDVNDDVNDDDDDDDVNDDVGISLLMEFT